MANEHTEKLATELKDTGIELSKPKKRARPKKSMKNASKQSAKRSRKPVAKTPWTFPKNSLEEALRIPRAIEDQNGGNPMRAEMLVKAVGFHKTNDWRFLDLLRSASLYGLVSGTGQTATVTIEQIGQDVIAPGSASQRQQALREAFRNVEDFKNVEEFYRNKKLPEDEFFENTLVRQFNIPRDKVRAFIEVFTTNLNFLKAFHADGSNSPTTMDGIGDGLVQPSKIVGTDEPSKGRAFLDTCFVMMPFGHWFDTYYKEIYVPAIREAGMEPVRADELFSTGSVIEQISEQIEKSKILLADLTGKNANVFYELGLAHGATKPVVFTSGALEDVPFDLRHLRVAIYDVRDPNWGLKLKETLTVFLKNAKSEPEKSIPQPFRERQKAKKEAMGG